MEQTTARDGELLSARNGCDPQCDITFQLFQQSIPEVAGGQERAGTAGKRRRVDAEDHAQCRLIDRQSWQWPRVTWVAEGVADFDRLDATDGGDVASCGFLSVNSPQLVKNLEAGCLRRHERSLKC